MSKKSRGGKAPNKTRRDIYKANAISNRIRRLARHLKKHPTDKQAEKAKENPTVRSGRTPNTRYKTLIKTGVIGSGEAQWVKIFKVDKTMQAADRRDRIAAKVAGQFRHAAFSY